MQHFSCKLQDYVISLDKIFLVQNVLFPDVTSGIYGFTLKHIKKILNFVLFPTNQLLRNWVMEILFIKAQIKLKANIFKCLYYLSTNSYSCTWMLVQFCAIFRFFVTQYLRHCWTDRKKKIKFFLMCL